MQLKHLLGFFSGVNQMKVSSASVVPNSFTSPLSDTTIHAGQTLELTWENPAGPVVGLSLVHGDPANLQQAAVIGQDVPNQGSMYWTVPETVAAGQYAVKLLAVDGNANFSPFFTVYDPVSPARW